MTQLSLLPQIKMTELQQEILKILLKYQGRKNAIMSDAICLKLRISQRGLCEEIVKLIMLHEIRIGSSTANPPGYFIIITEEDAKYAVEQLMKRIRELSRRAMILRKQTTEDFSMQLMMDLEHKK